VKATQTKKKAMNRHTAAANKIKTWFKKKNFTLVASQDSFSFFP